MAVLSALLYVGPAVFCFAMTFCCCYCCCFDSRSCVGSVYWSVCLGFVTLNVFANFPPTLAGCAASLEASRAQRNNAHHSCPFTFCFCF